MILSMCNNYLLIISNFAELLNEHQFKKSMHYLTIKRLLIPIILLIFFSSCKNKIEWETHPSGLKYRLISKNESGTKVNKGNILSLKMRYVDSNDSVLFDTKEIRGVYRMQLNDNSHEGGCVEDAFSMMNVGDSIEFKVNANNFYQFSRKMDVPSGVKPGSDITFFVKLAGIQTFNEIKKEREAQYHSNLEEEDELLEHYLKIMNIKTEPVLSGLYYIEKEKGTGKKAEAGHKVSLHYTGKFIDGQIFDSSHERNKPFNFLLGAGLVIIGMEEGVAKMHEGGKATLIIPSALGYKDQQNGPVPPYSTLIFEIELLKVY